MRAGEVDTHECTLQHPRPFFCLVAEIDWGVRYAAKWNSPAGLQVKAIKEYLWDGGLNKTDNLRTPWTTMEARG